MTSRTDSATTVDLPHAPSAVLEALQEQLDMLNHLALTLKHAHWNVTGPHFIAIHTMLDPQVAAVRDMVDDIAERMASIGGSPDGRAAGLVRRCRGPEYPLGRADALRHVAALDQEYGRVVTAHRSAAHRAEADPVTHDLLTAQSAELERFHWFVSAHTQSDSS